jgi:hypothetical protein
MRKLGFLTLIPLSAGVIALTVGALWLVGSSSGQRERFSSLEIAPADPVFYMAINTEPSSSQWIAVSDVLGTVNAKESLRDAIDEELLRFGLQFERDILPLAGDEGYVAITDIDALADKTGGFVAAFRLRDPARAEQIVLNVAGQEGTEFTEEDYEGVTIREAHDATDGDPNDDGAIAFADNVMVFGASPKDVTGVIDVIQGRAPNAETDERLAAMRARQTEDFLVWGYADLTQLWGFLETYLEDNAPEEFQSSFNSELLLRQARDNYDQLTFALSSRGDGFVFDYSYIVPAQSPDKLGLGVPFDSGYAERVPADTMFFFAGNDLYRQGYLPGQDEVFDTPGPEGETVKDIVGGIERELGIDLEDDLLSLMTGEVALAGNVSNLSGDEPEFELLGLAEVNDAAKMENTMRTLGDFLEREDLATVEDSGREGVHRWSVAQAPDAAAWTVDNGDAILGYPESAVTEALDGEGESLAETADWKRIMEILPGQRTSIGYISLARLIEEARQLEGAETDFEQSTEGKLTFDDLAPIRALGFATTTTDDGYGARVVLLIAD